MRNKLRNSNFRVKKIVYLRSFFAGNPMRNIFIVFKFISSEFLKRFFETDVQFIFTLSSWTSLKILITETILFNLRKHESDEMTFKIQKKYNNRIKLKFCT